MNEKTSMTTQSDWLLLDVSYLAYRAYYATPGLQHDFIPTAVPFGVMRDIQTFTRDFNTENVCYCFDVGKGFREGIYPDYKISRRTKVASGSDDAKAIISIKEQIRHLRLEHLPKLGIKNIYGRIGYEADDMIAALKIGICKNGGNCIIISADQDLYQLLDNNCIIWNPHTKQPYVEDSLFQEYGVSPWQWPTVKAIAGCGTDDVPGVTNVANKTAAKWITKELSKGIRYEAINEWVKSPQYGINLQLVTLPFMGNLKVQKPVTDTIDKDAWDELADQLGMRTMRGKPPAKKTHGGFNLGV